MIRRGLVLLFLAAFAAGVPLAAGPGAPAGDAAPSATPAPAHVRTDRVVKTNAEWKALLTPEQYEIAREKGTEAPFTGPYLDNHEKGTYACVACGLPLFASKTKFDSGTGWPSFWQPIADDAVLENGPRRPAQVPGRGGPHAARGAEVVCARCGAHLGDVFDDGPKPTGLRYCINGTALRFVAAK